ncbi:MAG: TIGR04283 family arsenosugar biosynthesis glycosyltransferase [Rhodobacteraceae bacterium]|nr:TIGR04283 family arsenosugar biosynthesis glycosyltransferase [Paracoccaceae bacterium]
MSAPISIVIPTLNAADRLGPTLAALMPGVVEGVIQELILSDGGSEDEIVAVAEGVGAEFVLGPPGRGGQLRRGAAAARGDWLIFLHADTALAPGWEAVVARHIAEVGAERAGFFHLAFHDNSFAARWVAGWANTRSGLLAMPYGDQGLLISRRLYDAVGGYRDIPLMEDVAIIRALGRKRLRRLPVMAVTSAERYQREGWLLRGLKNWRCLGLYFLGVAPEKILEKYK